MRPTAARRRHNSFSSRPSDVLSDFDVRLDRYPELDERSIRIEDVARNQSVNPASIRPPASATLKDSDA